MSKQSLEEMCKKGNVKGLLKAFFDAGGTISKKGFLSDMPFSYDGCEQGYAIQLLGSTREGRKLKKETLRKYNNLDMDEYGQKI